MNTGISTHMGFDSIHTAPVYMSVPVCVGNLVTTR